MVRIVQGDITKLTVDAIVNAANQVMLGGGGVDGAIHRAAGRELYEACLKVPEVRPGVRCPTGEARITPGFKLPAKFVIHTVGPVYRDGEHGEPEKLANCYRNSLALAAENGCNEIEEPPDLPDFEEIPNEPWEDWCKRQKEYWDQLSAAMEKTHQQMQKQCEQNKFFVRRLEEMGKFGELEYELAFRLRHTYINPKTGEQEYRPDDNVGEGLICLGSRDYNPRREDFDD